MPSDANGVYTLPDGYLAVTGETILASQHNPPLEDLASSMTQRLMASGAKPLTGPLKLADGVVSAPGVAFSSAPSTGMYKTADGLGFSVGGVQVAELVSGGLKTGALPIGAIYDWTGSTAPSLGVFPVGQTLSRSSYPELWTFAQTEIAAGNTLYNNGNGSTTFGVPDMRGRVRAIKDNMGGSAASRLTSATMNPDGNTLGAINLLTETRTLVTANLPAYTPSGTVISTVTNGTKAGTAGSTSFRTDGGLATAPLGAADILVGSTFTGAAQGGTSTPLSIVQPTIITNCVLVTGRP